MSQHVAGEKGAVNISRMCIEYSTYGELSMRP